LDFSPPEVADRVIKSGNMSDAVVARSINIDPESANDFFAASEEVAHMQDDAISAVAVTSKEVITGNRAVRDD
jgi:hypothetical protein